MQEFLALLDGGVPEQQVHSFLAERSYFFFSVMRLEGASPLYSKVRLGNDYEVDFAWFDTSSTGAEWRLMEIEAPSRPMFTKGGQPSSWLNHAIQQVRDWNGWIHENLSYARKLMPHVAYPLGFVVLGRRRDLTPGTATRLRRLSYEHRQYLEIHTFDWLADSALKVRRFVSDAGASWSTPFHAYSHRELREREPRSAFRWLFGPYATAMATDGLELRLESRQRSYKENDDVEAIIGIRRREKHKAWLEQIPPAPNVEDF